MVTRLNGTTKEIDRGQQNCFCTNQRYGLGLIQGSSRCSGDEPFGGHPASSGGTDSIGESDLKRETNFDGKILERLEHLEEAHFAYLNNQRKLLESELEENRLQAEKLRQSIQDLKKQVYDLIKKE